MYPVISVLPLSFGGVHSRAALKPQTSTSFTLAGGPGRSKENTHYIHDKFKSKGNFSINMGQKRHLDCTHTHTHHNRQQLTTNMVMAEGSTVRGVTYVDKCSGYLTQ